MCLEITDRLTQGFFQCFNHQQVVGESISWESQSWIRRIFGKKFGETVFWKGRFLNGQQALQQHFVHFLSMIVLPPKKKVVWRYFWRLYIIHHYPHLCCKLSCNMFPLFFPICFHGGHGKLSQHVTCLPVNKGFETMQPTGAPGLAKCIITFCHQREGCSEVRKVWKKGRFWKVCKLPFKNKQLFFFKAIIMAITIFWRWGIWGKHSWRKCTRASFPFQRCCFFNGLIKEGKVWKWFISS